MKQTNTRLIKKQKDYRRKSKSTTNRSIAILNIAIVIFIGAGLILHRIDQPPLNEQVSSKPKIENLFDVIAQEQQNKKFNNLISEVTSIPLPPDTDEYRRIQSCLMRNVFYEAPRYFPGMEKEKKFLPLAEGSFQKDKAGNFVASDDDLYAVIKVKLLDKIVKERIRVINVTTNRVKSEMYTNDYCKVIYQHQQFSWTMDPIKVKKGLYDIYDGDQIELANVEDVKKLVDYELTVGFPDTTQGAMYYHTHDVDPYWSETKEFTVASLWHNYYAQPDR